VGRRGGGGAARAATLGRSLARSPPAFSRPPPPLSRPNKKQTHERCCLVFISLPPFHRLSHPCKLLVPGLRPAWPGFFFACRRRPRPPTPRPRGPDGVPPPPLPLCRLGPLCPRARAPAPPRPRRPHYAPILVSKNTSPNSFAGPPFLYNQPPPPPNHPTTPQRSAPPQAESNNNNDMAPPPPAAPPAPALPRTDTAVKNLASLCKCCREPVPGSDPVEHPHRPFMERAIELSRIGGLEKRTGGCFGAVVVRNGVVSFFFFFFGGGGGVSAAPVGADARARAQLAARAPRSPAARLAWMGARCARGPRPATAGGARVGGSDGRERGKRSRARENSRPHNDSSLSSARPLPPTSTDRRRGLQQRRQLQRPHVVSPVLVGWAGAWRSGCNLEESDARAKRGGGGAPFALAPSLSPARAHGLSSFGAARGAIGRHATSRDPAPRDRTGGAPR
jgi:hypothetical protein